MGVFVYLPLVLPLTALPVARLAAHHLHPRSATRLLTAVGTTLALCSTLCLALLMVVGTAQLPGNPLPDGWSDPEVRAALPYEDRTGLRRSASWAWWWPAARRRSSAMSVPGSPRPGRWRRRGRWTSTG